MIPLRATPQPTTPPPVTVIRPARSGWQWSVVGMAFGAMAVVAFLLLALKGLFFGGEAPTPAPAAAPQIVTQTSVSVTEVAATTGSISGEVIMSGTSWEGHIIYVNLVPWGEFIATASTSLTAPGPYRLTDIPPGDYTLRVLVDMDNSGDGSPGDVIAMYSTEDQQPMIAVVAGQELTGMDVTLVAVQREATLVAVANIACTPAPGVGKGSVSGSASVGVAPIPAGPIYVNLLLPDGSPTTYSIRLEEAGLYKLGDVADGTYMVVAVLDTTGSGPTGASQNNFVGWYGGGPQSVKTVTISGGCDIRDVDIVISEQGLQQTTIPTPTTGPQATATSAPAGAALATATGAGTGGTTGTISGTVSIGEQCPDGRVHTIFVQASLSGQAGGPPNYQITISTPGAYSLRNVTPGDYTALARMDCSDAGPGRAYSGDVIGRHSGIVTVTAGGEVGGVDMTLNERAP